MASSLAAAAGAGAGAGAKTPPAAAAFTSSIRLVDAQGRNQIHALAKEGNAQQIKFLFSPEYKRTFNLESPFDLPDHEGLTPLMLAAGEGHLEACRVLIDCGAIEIRKDKQKKSALDHASAKQHVPVMQFLKAQEARFQKVESAADTAAKVAEAIKSSKSQRASLSSELHLATHTAMQQRNITASLQAAGMLKGNQGEKEPNVLHRAVMGGNPQTVRTVLQQQRELLNEKTQEGNTPLLIAASLGSGVICNILMAAGADASLTNNEGRNIFHEAISGPHPEIIEQFPLKRKELLNAQDRNGDTPLHVGAECRRTKQCQLLLTSGATVLRNNLLQSPLDKAREVVAMDIVRLLTEHISAAIAKGTLTADFAGPAPKVQKEKSPFQVHKETEEPVDEYGRTELHNAVRDRLDDAAFKQLCIKMRHALNQRAQGGETALMLNAETRNSSHGQMLLEAGAKIDIVDGLGRNVLHLAAREGNENLLLLVLRYHHVVATRLLSSRDEEGNTPFLLAASPDWGSYAKDTYSVCEFFVELGKGCDAVNNRKENALHCAVWAENLKLVNLFVNPKHKKLLGALLEGRDEKGHTPLRKAVERGSSVLCGTLLLAGADLYARADDNSSVMDAVKAKKQGSLTTLFMDWEKSLPSSAKQAAAAAAGAGEGTVKPTPPLPPKEAVAKAVTALPVASGATAVALPLPEATVAELLALPGKHEALAKRQHEMEGQMAQLATLNIPALQSLQARANQFDHLFAADALSAEAEAESGRIAEHPQTQIYYEYFCRFLTGTWLACQSISTGLIKNSEMNKADYLVKGIGTVGSCVPGLAGVMTVFTGVFEKWSDRDKLPGIQRIASLFPDLESAVKHLGKIARQVTLSQRDLIVSLEAVSKDTLTQIKGGLKDMKAFFLGDDAKGALKQRAREDCERVLTAVKDEKPHPKPSPDDLVRVIMGVNFIYPKAPLPPAQAPQLGMAAASPSAAVAAAFPHAAAAAAESVTVLELMRHMEAMRREHEEMARKLKALEAQNKPSESEVAVEGEAQAQLQLRAQSNTQRVQGSFSPAGVAVIEETTRVLTVTTTVHTARLEEHSESLDALRERIRLLEMKQKK